MWLKLNFVGLFVDDFNAAFDFYNGVLGMVARYRQPTWAYWETTGAIFEMFGVGNRTPRPWQSVIPTLAVTGFDHVVERLRAHGVSMAEPVPPDGEGVSFSDPEGWIWNLAHEVPRIAAGGLDRPHINGFSLLCEHMAEQERFYRDLMQMRLSAVELGRTTFVQDAHEPVLRLVAGGRARPRIANRIEAPHDISFETDDIEEAHRWLRSAGADFMQDVTSKPWGGIDLYVRDPDNNPVQVVQYVRGDK